MLGGDARRLNGFGDLLRARRVAALLTQEGLADQAGLSVRTVRNLECGSVAPRIDTARRLADALSLPQPLRTEFLLAAGVPAAPKPAGPLPPPSQLPARPPDLVGRAALIARVTAILGTPAPEPRTPVVVVLTGPAGVGKTTLAVHAAYQVQECFADGQLFVSLREAGPHPAAPVDILERVLRLLGVPGADLPPVYDDRLALFRSQMTHRRVLIVLDDARCEEQVRPLIPGGGTGALLVTGRRRLTALEHAHVFDVEPFLPAEGVELLAHVAGADRVGSEPDAAAQIAERCGGLPLALRIAGVKLAARPHLSLTRLASRLADEKTRLDELSYGDLAIRASIALTYDTLDARCRSAFRLLSLADLVSIPSWLAAAALRNTVADVEQVLEQLVDARLLDADVVADDIRYRYHGLLRVYAQERAAAEDPDDAAATVLGAALDSTLPAARYAWEQLGALADGPPLPTAPARPPPVEVMTVVDRDPVGWFDVERDNLVVLVRRCGELPVFDERTQALAFFLRRLDEFAVTRSRHDVVADRPTASIDLTARYVEPAPPS